MSGTMTERSPASVCPSSSERDSSAPALTSCCSRPWPARRRRAPCAPLRAAGSRSSLAARAQQQRRRDQRVRTPPRSPPMQARRARRPARRGRARRRRHGGARSARACSPEASQSERWLPRAEREQRCRRRRRAPNRRCALLADRTTARRARPPSSSTGRAPAPIDFGPFERQSSCPDRFVSAGRGAASSRLQGRPTDARADEPGRGRASGRRGGCCESNTETIQSSGTRWLLIDAPGSRPAGRSQLST